MTAKSYSRGHEIHYINEEWIYADNGKLEDDNRACARCKKQPTKEGHDACLGHIDGAIGACCGHGVDEKYIIKETK